jgi:hypothetical protein
MKPSIRILLPIIWIAAIANLAWASDLGSLKVLYVGDQGSEREQAFSAFLQKQVASVSTANREGFDSESAASYDVVLLDWSQDSVHDHAPGWGSRLVSPLGARDHWCKPTVLLGSAGLHLAVAWRLKGGSGCTCMAPLAYGLRDHEIFEKPFKIDRTRMVSIPTPVDFQGDIKERTIQVLPLVDDIGAQWRMGWCTYARDFPRNPDTEYFCGGVNHKTPEAAGLWRQGNLLHFGFEQSPAQMNLVGQQILLNAIVYISRFTEDRPIAITPSPFAGKVPVSRRVVAERFASSDWPMAAIEEAFAPDLWRQLPVNSRKDLVAWADVNARFLHPNPDKQMEFDEDLRELNVPFDQPAFLDLVVAQLRGSAEERARGARLVERYLPDISKPADAETVAAWVRENRPYLFASDSLDYRYYVDPLAKRRGVPTIDLRGPRRADQMPPATPAAPRGKGS